MTALDQKGLCLGYALERAEQMTGRHVDTSALIEIAAQTIVSDRVPDSVAGVRRIEVDDFGTPGDVMVMRGGAGLHAMVAVGGGLVEDQDPRGRKRRIPFRRIAWLAHSCWRLVA